MLVKVRNKGDRVRHRMGVGFPPNTEIAIEVTKKQYIMIKAVKDFEVKIVEPEDVETPIDEIETPQEPENNADKKTLNIRKLNITQVLEAVKNGEIGVDEAIEQEKKGENRKTLIEQLEQMKEGE